MALLDIYSFQDMSSAQLDRYGVVSNATYVVIDATGGRGGGPALKVGGQVSTLHYLSIPFTASATLVVGFWFKTNAIYSTPADQPFLSFYDGSTRHANLRFDASGHLYFCRDSTTIGSASAKAILANVPYYIEVKVTINDSTGVADLNVNGQNWLTQSSLDTRNSGNATASAIRLGHYSGTGTYAYFSDLYILSGSGGVRTAMLGPCRVDSVFFTADGNYTDWTASAGSRYACVDDNPANDDTDYVTGVTGNKCTFKTTTLPSSPTTIYGVKLTGVVKKTEAGALAVSRLMRKSAVDYAGSALTEPGTTYAVTSEVLEQDPATTANFTESDLEGQIEWGFQLA